MLPGDSDAQPYSNTIATEVPLLDNMGIRSPNWWVVKTGLGTHASVPSKLSGLHQGYGTDPILEGCVRFGHVEKMEDTTLEAPRKKSGGE